MAKCEEGYLCEVCGRDVENLRDSGLYLQFILGWIDPETLHTHREVHIDCLPALAQFIDDADYPRPTTEQTQPIATEFDRNRLDPQFVQTRVDQVTRAYRRLRELDNMSERPAVIEYPLPEAAQRWRA